MEAHEKGIEILTWAVCKASLAPAQEKEIDWSRMEKSAFLI